MANFRKNLMVGLTVLTALALLGFMIIKFGGAPAKLFAASKIPVRLHSERADGISNGSQITYRGVIVGTVDDVSLSPDQGAVIIHALLDERKSLPGNVVGRIRTTLIGGSSSMSLEVPENEKPQGVVHAEQDIPAHFVGTDIFPPAINDLADSLRKTSDDFRKSHLVDNVNAAVLSIRDTVNSAGKFLESLQKTVGDDKLRDDLHAAVANIRTATETVNRIGTHVEKFSGDLEKFGGSLNTLTTQASTTITKTQTHIDDLSRQIADRLEQVAKILADFQSVTDKLNQGKGTAGLLLNDPKLYESLVDTSRELSATITTLKRLVQQWEQEGVQLKLK